MYADIKNVQRSNISVSDRSLNMKEWPLETHIYDKALYVCMIPGTHRAFNSIPNILRFTASKTWVF